MQCLLGARPVAASAGELRSPPLSTHRAGALGCPAHQAFLAYVSSRYARMADDSNMAWPWPLGSCGVVGVGGWVGQGAGTGGSAGGQAGEVGWARDCGPGWLACQPLLGAPTLSLGRSTLH